MSMDMDKPPKELALQQVQDRIKEIEKLTRAPGLEKEEKARLHKELINLKITLTRRKNVLAKLPKIAPPGFAPP